MNSNISNPNISKSLIIGSLIVLIGAVILLLNLGIISGAWSRVFISWPMILIIIGCLTINRRNSWGSVILIVLGLVFLTPRLLDAFGIEYYYGIVRVIIWPVLIILAGLIVIFHGWDVNRSDHNPGYHTEDYNADHNSNTEHADSGRNSYGNYSRQSSWRTYQYTPDGQIHFDCVFDGIDTVHPAGTFKGGKISTIFGGVKLDLRNTTLPQGDTFLTADTVFGGIVLKVPSDWNVEIRNDRFLGAFVDKRYSRPSFTDPGSNGSRLIIMSETIFGGGTVE